MALALFADRLGTPTGVSESGTLGEIERLVIAGKPVCVLLNRGPRSLVGPEAVAEKHRLEHAIADLYRRAIVLSYTNQAELAGHLNNMLSRATGKVEGSVSAGAIQGSLLKQRSMACCAQGNYERNLLLRNETGRPVMDVSIRIPEETQMRILDAEKASQVWRQARKFGTRFSGPSAATFSRKCTVSWRFSMGTRGVCCQIRSSAIV